MGLMLEDGADISEQGVQNLRTLAKGSLEYEEVRDALRKLAVAGRGFARSGPRVFATGIREEDAADDEDDFDLLEHAGDELEEIVAELEALDFSGGRGPGDL